MDNRDKDYEHTLKEEIVKSVRDAILDELLQDYMERARQDHSEITRTPEHGPGVVETEGCPHFVRRQGPIQPATPEEIKAIFGVEPAVLSHEEFEPEPLPQYIEEPVIRVTHVRPRDPNDTSIPALECEICGAQCLDFFKVEIAVNPFIEEDGRLYTDGEDHLETHILCPDDWDGIGGDPIDVLLADIQKNVHYKGNL